MAIANARCPRINRASVAIGSLRGRPRTVLRLTAGCGIGIRWPVAHRPADLASSSQGTRRAKAPEWPPAEAEFVDEVYNALLDKFTIAHDKHYIDALVKRGLSLDQVTAEKYGRFPLNHGTFAAQLAEKFTREKLLGVPGFFLKDGAELWIAGGTGLLIPIRDPAGKIVAILVRPDRPIGKNKYYYLSSANKGGYGPGSRVHVPRGVVGPMKSLRVTEGGLKANIATALSGIPTIGIPGVDGWRKAVVIAKSFEVQDIHIAFDMDCVVNPKVGQALFDCFTGLAAEGFSVYFERWDAADGKGIDDLLAAGKFPEVLAGSEAKEAVRAIAKAAGENRLEEAQAGAKNAWASVPLDNNLGETDSAWESLDSDGKASLVIAKAKVLVEAAGIEALLTHKPLLIWLSMFDTATLAPLFAWLGKLLCRGYSLRSPRGPEEASPQGFAGRHGHGHRRIPNCRSLPCMDRLFRRAENGPSPRELATFNAWIAEEVVRDCGDERFGTLIHFVIEGIGKEGERFRAEVPAEKFNGLGWITSQFGSRAVVAAGRSSTEHLRVAIAKNKVEERSRSVVYTHTGWRAIERDGKPVNYYLSAGGAIGPDGLDKSIRVDLNEWGLGNYLLPGPPVGDDLRKAVRASLALGRLSQPDRPKARAVAALLRAGVYRAPLGPTRYSIQFSGATGERKSSTICLAQQHWGAGLDQFHLPKQWSSTYANIQSSLFAAKDAILTIDDWKSNGSRQEQQDLVSKAAAVFRDQGNGKGKERNGPDMRPLPTLDPRGSLNSTGESRTAVASAEARTYSVWFEGETKRSKATIDLDALAECQRDAKAGLYAARWPDTFAGSRRGSMTSGEGTSRPRPRHTRPPSSKATTAARRRRRESSPRGPTCSSASPWTLAPSPMPRPRSIAAISGRG